MFLKKYSKIFPKVPCKKNWVPLQYFLSIERQPFSISRAIGHGAAQAQMSLRCMFYGACRKERDYDKKIQEMDCSMRTGFVHIYERLW